MLYTPKWKFKQNVKCFCLFVYKFKNFVNTWHFSINIIYIHCCEVKNVLVFASKQKEKSKKCISNCLETERSLKNVLVLAWKQKEKSKKCISTCLETERKVARVSLVFLFLKLVQINFIFADSVFILPLEDDLFTWRWPYSLTDNMLQFHLKIALLSNKQYSTILLSKTMLVAIAWFVSCGGQINVGPNTIAMFCTSILFSLHRSLTL